MRIFHCQKGFTLFELITTLILIAIIGAFSGFFASSGIQGFLTSKFSSETALKAQIALDRISAELRHIQVLVTPLPTETSIGYRSIDLDGIRQISYDPVNQEILLSVNGTANVLLDNVSAFTFSSALADLDNSGDGNNEISRISVAFTVSSPSSGNATEFLAEIYPRSMLASP